jgi:AcrR family transcriptional regulator
MAVGGRQRRGEAGTPRGELTRLRAGREQLEDELEAAIGLAMLEACGERGYRSASVQDALDRGAGSRSQFYRHFSSKSACFEAAYESEAPRLVAVLLAAGRPGPSWPQGLLAALAELATQLEERPAPMRALLVEVHVAGGPALALRAELFERLASALDSARRADGALADPPALTARFMLGAVDAAAARALTLGQPAGFREQVLELARLIVSAYFGEEAGAALNPAACRSGRLSPTSGSRR